MTVAKRFPPNSIFMCYRRSDSEEIVDRVSDALAASFGQAVVFRDIDAIPAGVDFPSYIQESLRDCAVMLIFIGREWLHCTDDSGDRRLDDPGDHVRIEVETALGVPDACVIPVMVKNAPLPKHNELPESIRALSRRNGIQIRSSGADYKQDVARLSKEVANGAKRVIDARVHAAAEEKRRQELNRDSERRERESADQFQEEVDPPGAAPFGRAPRASADPRARKPPSASAPIDSSKGWLHWGYVVVGLYLSMMILIVMPLITFTGNWSTSAIGEMYRSLDFWIIIAFLGLSQFLLLRVPIRLSMKRPVSRASVWAPIVVSLFWLLLMGAAATVMIIEISSFRGVQHTWIEKAVIIVGWLVGLSWVIWGIIFFRSTRASDISEHATLQSRWLLRGSILELLIAVPTHIVARARGGVLRGRGNFPGDHDGRLRDAAIVRPFRVLSLLRTLAAAARGTGAMAIPCLIPCSSEQICGTPAFTGKGAWFCRRSLIAC